MKNKMSKVWSFLRRGLFGYFLKVKDGKNILIVGRVISAIVAFTLVVVVIEVLATEDASFYVQGKTLKHEKEKKHGFSEMYGSLYDTVETSAKKKAKKPRYSVKLKAIQVIAGQAIKSRNSKSTKGKRFIGRLLTKVDSRQTGTEVQVELPYGMQIGSHSSISKGSVLRGISHTTKGKRVGIKFNTLITTEGLEYPISAIALDSSDYAFGIKGRLHSKGLSRIATTVALGAANAAIGGIITREQSLNEDDDTRELVEKSLKTSGLQGISSGLGSEIQNSTNDLKSRNQDYVTVDFGKDLIVELVENVRLVREGE